MANINQHIQLIEKHFDNILNKNEQQTFDQLFQNDVQFAKEVQFFQKFLNSMDKLGDELFLANLQKLEQQIQIEKTAKDSSTNPLKNLTEKVLQKGGEILDDLAAAFLPIPQYETIIANVSRSDNLQVLQPENGFDCRENFLPFELKNPTNQKLQFSIEDNRQNVVIEQTFLTSTQQFEVDVKGLKTGRYYWKLKTNEDLIMGSFFIGKHLMAIN